MTESKSNFVACLALSGFIVGAFVAGLFKTRYDYRQLNREKNKVHDGLFKKSLDSLLDLKAKHPRVDFSEAFFCLEQAHRYLLTQSQQAVEEALAELSKLGAGSREWYKKLEQMTQQGVILN
jgi:uncharacterized protein HemY